MAKIPQPINIILLGDPAAGKATQSALLVKKYKLYDFDMGKELNVRRSRDKKLDTILKGNTDRGNLTPTKIVQAIHHEIIEKIPSTKGILYDGHPKMLTEAKLVRKLLKQHHRLAPLVIYLSIPVAETVKRIQGRKGYFTGKFGKRGDDSITALKNRAAYYRVNVAAVIKFFSSKYTFKKISGLGAVKEIEKRIDKEVEKYLRNV